MPRRVNQIDQETMRLVCRLREGIQIFLIQLVIQRNSSESIANVSLDDKSDIEITASLYHLVFMFDLQMAITVEHLKLSIQRTNISTTKSTNAPGKINKISHTTHIQSKRHFKNHESASESQRYYSNGQNILYDIGSYYRC